MKGELQTMQTEETVRAFPVFSDGQQMKMAEIALREKADRCECPTVARMYRLEANRFEAARKQFHAETYRQMAALYDLPQLDQEKKDDCRNPMASRFRWPQGFPVTL